jgi:hypothetical protein
MAVWKRSRSSGGAEYRVSGFPPRLSLRKRIRGIVEGPLKAVWIAFLALLIADSLDVLSSWLADRYVPIWQEGNFIARIPLVHRLMPGALLAAKGEEYVLLACFLLLLYRALRTRLDAGASALLASLPVWLSAWTAAFAAYGNICFTISWFGWMRRYEALYLLESLARR